MFDATTTTTSRPTAEASAAGGRGPLATVGVSCLLAVLLALAFRPAWGVVVLAAVMVPLERIWRRHDYRVFRPGWRADVLHLLFTHFLELACLLAAVGITWLVLHPFTVLPVAAALAALPLAGKVVVAFVLFQLTYYAEHRLAHEWGFLWRFHAVHHSSERLDWLAAARLHPLEAFFGGFVVAPVFVLAGFSPVTVAALSALDTLWSIVIHANVSWRLAFLDRIWQTPEYHHWHHSNEPEARNHNYGLPLLDTVFGTYFMPAERRPARYGVDQPAPEGYLAQLAWPLRRRSA